MQYHIVVKYWSQSADLFSKGWIIFAGLWRPVQQLSILSHELLTRITRVQMALFVSYAL